MIFLPNNLKQLFLFGLLISGLCLTSVAFGADPDQIAAAQELEESGEYVQAITAYEALLSEEPENDDFLFRIGRLHAWLDQWDIAEDYLNKSLDISSENLDTRFMLGKVLSWKGNHVDAKEQFEYVIAGDPKHVEAIIALGRAHQNIGNIKEAEFKYEAALELDPDNINAAAYLAQVSDQKKQESTPEVTEAPTQTESASVDANQMSELYKKALDDEKNHSYEEAIEAYSTLLNSSPENVEYLFRIGRLYLWTDQWDDAEGFLVKALTLDPNHLDSRLILGNLYSWQGDYQKAKLQYELLEKINPNHVEMLVQLGIVYRNLGDLETAKTKFKLALVQDEKNAEASKHLQQILDVENNVAIESSPQAVSGAGESEKNIAVASPKASAGNEADIQKLLNQANVHIQAAEFENALNLYETVLKSDPTNIDYLYTLSQLAAKLNNVSLTEDYVSRVLAVDASHFEARLILGNVYMVKKAFVEAEQEFKKLLLAQPDNPRVHLALGLLYRRLGSMAEAEEAFQEVLRLDPDNVNAATFLAKTSDAKRMRGILEKNAAEYEAAEKRLEAIDVYKKLVDLYPQNADYYHSLGRLYTWLDRWDDAQENLKKSLALNPDNVPAMQNLGNIYLWKGQYDEAMSLYSAVVRREPQNTKALISLSRVQWIMGDLANAEAGFRKVLELDPQNDEAVNSLKEIQQRMSKEETAVVLGQAENAESSRDYDRAISLYKQLSESTPANADYLYRLGRLNSWVNNWSEAEKYFEKCLTLDPDYLDARFAYGNMEIWRGNYDKAAEQLNYVADRRRNDPDLLVSLAIVDRNRRDFNDARDKLVKALKIDPNHREAALHLSRLAEAEKQAARQPEVVVPTEPPKAPEPMIDRQEQPTPSPMPPMLTQPVPSMDSRQQYENPSSNAIGKAIDDLDREINRYTHEAENYRWNPDYQYSGVETVTGASQPSSYAEARDYPDARLEAPSTPEEVLEVDESEEDNKMKFTVSQSFKYAEERERHEGADRVGVEINEFLAETRLFVEKSSKSNIRIKWGTGYQSEDNVTSEVVNYKGRIRKIDFRVNTRADNGIEFSAYGGFKQVTNDDESAIFPLEDENTVEPGVLLRYQRGEHFWLGTAFQDSFIIKDFTNLRTSLLERQNVEGIYERTFMPHRTYGGKAGMKYFNDSADNKEFVSSFWFRMGIPGFEEVLEARYQLDYNDFEKDVPEYYSFEKQSVNSLSLKYEAPIDEFTNIVTSYLHSWSRTNEAVNSGRIVATTGAITPGLAEWDFFQGNEAVFKIQRSLGSSTSLEFAGSYYWNSHEYEALKVDGYFIHRF